MLLFQNFEHADHGLLIVDHGADSSVRLHEGERTCALRLCRQGANR